MGSRGVERERHANAITLVGGDGVTHGAPMDSPQCHYGTIVLYCKVQTIGSIEVYTNQLCISRQAICRAYVTLVTAPFRLA
jgi:hypothetical protein